MRCHVGGEIEHHFVHIAPPPALRRIIAFDNRMFAALKMFRGMFVFGIVATADVTAGEAQAQMDPGVAYFQALLAAISAGFHFVDRRQVRAARTHIYP